MSQDKEQPKLPIYSILGQFVKDLSFENVYISKATGAQLKGTPKFDTRADVSFRQAQKANAQSPNDIYEVNLHMHVKATDVDQNDADTTLFIVEVKYCGVVSINPDCDQNYIEPLLMVEIPNYLFFELRHFMAHIIWQGGYPPIFLRYVDFKALYEQKLQQQKQQSAN